MDETKFQRGFDIIKCHYGEFYPIQRLFFYIVGMADMIHWRKFVCSELVARYLHEICKWDLIFDFEGYFGTTPDNLMDIVRISPHFDVVYEGTL